MAFQQPTRQPFQRSIRLAEDEGESPTSTFQAPPPAEESQTWVIFSPATDAGTSASYLSSLHESQQTPGRSRLSDPGSLNTIARSDVNSQPANSVVAPVLSERMDEDAAEDDAELDCLDSHLPEFRSLPEVPSTSVLPAHDGLGSFRLDTTATASEMQEHMYALERFNPRRIKRRRESLDLAQVQLEREHTEVLERNERIEEWRLEHSRLLLAEIQKETRRRGHARAVSPGVKSERRAKAADSADSAETPGDATQAEPAQGSDWHEQDIPDVADQEQVGMWSRLTLKFIRDFMGINDETLSILFGEALPGEDDVSSTPTATAREASHDDSSWQLRMMERISRELGMLIHRLSRHPGAFSTYVHVQQQPLPYAGLPVIPEAVADVHELPKELVGDASTSSMPQFQPTIRHMSVNVAAQGAETAKSEGNNREGQQGTASFTEQEWEQDLDIMLVFRYLRSRFTSPSGPPASVGGTAHPPTSGPQDAAANAARVRQHHPLAGRSRQSERRAFRGTAPASPAVLRHGSTCASQSTRRSARRSSASSRASSRHYWDIGGSMGTSSMIASTGPMGSWGEL